LEECKTALDNAVRARKQAEMDLEEVKVLFWKLREIKIKNNN
jgi:hypothetical protein